MRLTLMAGAVLSAAAIALWPAQAEAQRRGRAPTIEIRGQVPTPQVVTVRPREVPDFSRAVLVPRFYDRHFWTVITPAYQIVPRSTVTGSAMDTIMLVSTPAGAPGIGVEAPAPPRGDTAMAPSPTLSNDAELEAIRRELELRRARLDSIAAKVKGMGEARDTTERRPPPPQSPGPAAASRRQSAGGQPGSASARSRDDA